MFKKLYLYQLKSLVSFLPFMIGSLFIHEGITDGNLNQSYYGISIAMYLISFLMGMAGVAVSFRHVTLLGVSRRDFYVSLVARQLTFAVVYVILLLSLVPLIANLYPSNVHLDVINPHNELYGSPKGYLAVFMAHIIFGLLGNHLALIFNKVNAVWRGVILGLVTLAVYSLSVFWDTGGGATLVFLMETALKVGPLGFIAILLVILWLSIVTHNSKDYY